ncbi:MAG: cysteine peptidase family C39 domain-containing protein, partial [Candidatus Saccharimonadales bacterium]
MHDMFLKAASAALLLSLCAPVATCATGKADAEGQALACGPRAVFLLLNDQGIPATYEEVRAAIPLSSQGASVRDLQWCLLSYGITASARRLEPSDLVRYHQPMIAYFPSRSERRAAGHFVYVSSAADEGLEIIEPMTGRRFPRWPWRDFSDEWDDLCILVDVEPLLVHDPLFWMSMTNAMLMALLLRVRSPVWLGFVRRGCASCAVASALCSTGLVVPARSAEPEELVRS